MNRVWSRNGSARRSSWLGKGLGLVQIVLACELAGAARTDRGLEGPPQGRCRQEFAALPINEAPASGRDASKPRSGTGRASPPRTDPPPLGSCAYQMDLQDHPPMIRASPPKPPTRSFLIGKDTSDTYGRYSRILVKCISSIEPVRLLRSWTTIASVEFSVNRSV